MRSRFGRLETYIDIDTHIETTNFTQKCFTFLRRIYDESVMITNRKKLVSMLMLQLSLCIVRLFARMSRTQKMVIFQGFQCVLCFAFAINILIFVHTKGIN